MATIKKPFLVCGMLVAVAATSIFLIPSKDKPVPHLESEASIDQQLSKQQSLSTPETSINELGYSSKQGALSLGQQGAKLGIELAVDEDGNLRISNDIRTVFDYFLSAIDDEPLENIIARINEYLEHHLEERLSQAKTILTHYIDMKTALFDLEQELGENIQAGELSSENYLELLKYQLDQRNNLRAQYLSPEVHEAFYQEEEQYDAFTYERMLILSNKQLNEETRQHQLAQLESQLPEEIQEARRETQITDVLKAKTLALKESGATQEEITALRQEMFGEEAVERFDQLDQERAEWQGRLDTYMSQRADLLSNEGLSQEEKEAQVQTLKESMFDTREQIRVSVYERKS